ncbi:MAG: 16S rRNA (cytidine(1402)-2'-O)-methyltransferase, partial [Desulfovibrio sp.]|nr:16S rRNA (cytidine(1402)-2'-O)-methyltransferase [Desulfovibrio sp.]
YAPIPGSLAFFERKDRLWDSLKIAGAILGDREVAICRELTKPHEEIIFARLGALEERELLGEITVIIGPATAKPKTDEESVRASLKRRMAEGLTPRQAVAVVRRESSGWSGKDIYKLARNPD